MIIHITTDIITIDINLFAGRQASLSQCQSQVRVNRDGWRQEGHLREPDYGDPI